MGPAVIKKWFKYVFNAHPYLGNDPMWRAYFSDGLKSPSDFLARVLKALLFTVGFSTIQTVAFSQQQYHFGHTDPQTHGWFFPSWRSSTNPPGHIAGLIKGNQWLISPDHKAGYFLGGCTWPGGVGWLAVIPAPKTRIFDFFGMPWKFTTKIKTKNIQKSFKSPCQGIGA